MEHPFISGVGHPTPLSVASGAPYGLFQSHVRTNCPPLRKLKFFLVCKFIVPYGCGTDAILCKDLIKSARPRLQYDAELSW